MRLLRALLLSAGTARIDRGGDHHRLVWSVGGTLAWPSANLPVLYPALPLAAVLAALRLRLLGRTFWEQLRREIVVAALLTVAISGVWFASSLLAVRFSSVPRDAFVTSSLIGAVLLGLLPGVVYAGARASLYSWIFWNRLRRKRFAWALTHAMLITVALVSLLFMSIILIQLRQDTLPLIGAVMGAMILITAGIMTGAPAVLCALLLYLCPAHDPPDRHAGGSHKRPAAGPVYNPRDGCRRR